MPTPAAPPPERSPDARHAAPESSDIEVFLADVGRALARVDESNRDAVQMHYFAGLTQTRIAAVLDLPVRTVGRRIAVGLQQFDRAFRDLVPVPGHG